MLFAINFGVKEFVEDYENRGVWVFQGIPVHAGKWQRWQSHARRSCEVVVSKSGTPSLTNPKFRTGNATIFLNAIWEREVNYEAD